MHSPPVDESVDVVGKERGKTYNNRDVFHVVHRSQAPEDDQNSVINGICGGEQRTSAERQIHREKARCHGKRAWNEVRRAEVF